MIEAKQAVAKAKEIAASMLEPSQFSLEELERDSYKGREVWRITLSSPKPRNPASLFASQLADPLQYKLFLIDAETGELVAMKIREVALQ